MSFSEIYGPTALSAEFHLRLQRAKHSQMEYGKLFRKLNIIIDQMKEKFPAAQETTSSNSTTMSADLYDDQYSASEKEDKVHKSKKRKFASLENDTVKDETKLDSIHDNYPQYSDDGTVCLGPGGTQIDAALFDEISWQSGAIATRSLLGHIFSPDILATHSLTGKPSPAFRGDRERPSKMQLDHTKVRDIIECVRSKCGSNEREIRAAITTKCADSSKKNKRRLLKQLKFNNSVSP